MLPSEYLAQGWCQEVSAKDQAGNRIPSKDPEAKEWCFMGAVEAWGGNSVGYREKALELLLLPVPEIILGSPLPNWNDQPERTQAEVVALAWRVEMALGLRLRCLAEQEPNDLVEVEPVLEPVKLRDEPVS